MPEPLTDMKVNLLKRSLVRFFDNDDSFVDISTVRSDKNI